MRKIEIVIGANPVGEQKTWAYPAGTSLGHFKVPIYDCFVSGRDKSGRSVRERFDVLRFGVQCTDGIKAKIVGLADQQTHKIKAWIPTYRVHSAPSNEDGAWQVYGNFLIHDGPNHAAEIYASIGCIEVMGASGFVRFNDLLISLAGPKANSRAMQLAEIGSRGDIYITYMQASRPPLIRLTP